MPDMGDYGIDSGSCWARFSEQYASEFASEPRLGDRVQPQDAKPESNGSGPEGSSPLGGHSG